MPTSLEFALSGNFNVERQQSPAYCGLYSVGWLRCETTSQLYWSRCDRVHQRSGGGAGDSEKLSTIKGRVIGARPGQQIVLYAKGETAWWVQPFVDQPFTTIHPNAKWRNVTHPGTEYAALLVGPGFRPPPISEQLPTEGVVTFAVTHGELPYRQRWWFPFVCILGGVLAIFGLHRLRIHQMTRKLNLRFEERLAERMLVAQELHDTLLQGVLSASMQLHVAVDQLPAESPAQPALGRVLELMAQVVEEGRNTVRGLRSTIDNAHDLEHSFSRIPRGAQHPEGHRVSGDRGRAGFGPVVHYSQ